MLNGIGSQISVQSLNIKDKFQFQHQKLGKLMSESLTYEFR